MKALSVSRWPDFVELDVRVTSWSTIRVKHNAYSVPSQLRDEWVRVRLYDNSLQIYYGGKHQLTVERLRGRNGHRIDYRHIIWSLVQKPGAFARYKFREALFPTLAFRRAYDALSATLSSYEADVEYLRVLHLAASTMESEVEAALVLLLDSGELSGADAVKALVRSAEPAVPQMPAYEVDLGSYDDLLDEEVAS